MLTHGLHRAGVAPCWYATSKLTLYDSGKSPYAIHEVAFKPPWLSCRSVQCGEAIVPHQACQNETDPEFPSLTLRTHSFSVRRTLEIMTFVRRFAPFAAIYHAAAARAAGKTSCRKRRAADMTR